MASAGSRLGAWGEWTGWHKWVMGRVGGSVMGKVTDSGRVGHGRPGFLPVGRVSGAGDRLGFRVDC